MKLLLFSDVHCDKAAARRLVQQAKGTDVVIGAGDFGNMRQGLKVVLDVLREIDRPAVLVPGNAESVEELAAACRSWRSAHVLHGSSVSIDGVSFYGLGGAVPVTPFGSWSYDFSEKQAAELLAGCPAGCVLVTHSPPKGTVDVSSSGRSLGSQAVRTAIERVHPLLVVCGHIHTCAGQSGMIRSTPVVNAGPDGVLWTIDNSPSPESPTL
jgi:Icc-related predicted phosphoesterase